MKNFVWLLLPWFVAPVWGQNPLDSFNRWPKEFLSGGTLICREPVNGKQEYPFTDWRFYPDVWSTSSKYIDCDNTNEYRVISNGCTSLGSRSTTTYYGQEIGYLNHPDHPQVTDQNIIRSSEGLYLQLRDLPVPRIVTCTTKDDPITPINEEETFEITCYVSGAQLSSTTRFNMGVYEIEYETFLGDYIGSDNWPSFWLWHHDEIDVMDNDRWGPIGEGYNQRQPFPHSNGPATIRMEWTPFKLIIERNGFELELFKYYRFNQAGNNMGPLDVECGDQIPPGYYKVNPAFPNSDGHLPNEGGRYMQVMLSLSHNPWFCPDGLADPANSKILIKSFNYTPILYTNVNLNLECDYSLLCPGSEPCHKLKYFHYTPSFVFDPENQGLTHGLISSFKATNWNIVNGIMKSSTDSEVCLYPYDTDYYMIVVTFIDETTGNQYTLSQRFEQPDPPTGLLFTVPGTQNQEKYLHVELNGYCKDDITVSSIPPDAFTEDNPESPYPRPINGSIVYKLKEGVDLECITVNYPEPCTGNILTAAISFQIPLKGFIAPQTGLGITPIKNDQTIDYNYFTINLDYPGLNTYQWQKISGNGYIYGAAGAAVAGYLPWGAITIRVTITNEFGCTFSHDIIVRYSRPLGLVSIQPNPGTNEITISLNRSIILISPSEKSTVNRASTHPSIKQVRVFDANGHLHLDQFCGQESLTQTLQVATLQPGIYRVEITDDLGRVYTDTFVKI